MRARGFVRYLPLFLQLAWRAASSQSSSFIDQERCRSEPNPSQVQIYGSGTWQTMSHGPWTCATKSMMPLTIPNDVRGSVYRAATNVGSSTTIASDTSSASGVSIADHESIATASASRANGSHAYEAHVNSSNVQNNTFRSVAYFANWDIYARKFNVSDIPVNRLTHIIYAFATITSDGDVCLSDVYADVGSQQQANGTDKQLRGNLGQLFQLKTANRQLKTLLSVGGWSYGAQFSGWANTAAGRATFARTAVDLVKDLGFDGLDIDWEYPLSETDAENFVLLLQAIRAEMTASEGREPGQPAFLLTVACSAGPEHYQLLKIKEMNELVDFWSLMAFDYAGSWSHASGHLANVYPSKDDPVCTPFNTDAAVDFYLHNGIPAHRLVLGMPLYGRAFVGTEGPGQPFQGVGTANGNGSWESGVWDYKALPRPGASTFHDKNVVASWSHNQVSGEMISYDSPEIASSKAAYIQGRRLGGAMWWEISGDRSSDSDSLVNTVTQHFKRLEGWSLDCSSNRLRYPNSTYQNVRDAQH